MTRLGFALGLLALCALLAATARADDAEATHAGRPSLYCEPPLVRCRSGCFERGFDGMLYVAETHERARLGVAGYVQMRADWGESESRTTTQFDVERLRLILDGHVTKRWLYHVRAGFDDGTDFGLPLAYVTWRPTSRLSLHLGQQFIAVSREDWMFAEDLLTTEYSANDAVFGTGISKGLQAVYEGRHDRVYAGISSGEIGPQSEFLGSVASAEWGLTGRYERQLLTTDWSTWDDLVGRVGRPRGVLVGVGLGVAHLGEGDDRGNDFLATADASFSWARGQALAYASARHTRPDDGPEFTQYGLFVQAGHFVAPTVQFYGRYEMVDPGSQPGSLATYQAATLGCSYLPFRWTNRLRLSLELSQLFTGISRTIVPARGALGFSPSTDPQLHVRLQAQIGF